MAKVEVQFKDIQLTVPWGYVAARTYGSPTGEPVLMVHGIQDNAGSFTRLVKYLPMESFYYVCIDLPGHGWSSHFPSYMTLSFMEYANAMHFILKALQWQTCIYIGHSLGGQIGLVFSVMEPHRLKKIICLDGFLTIPDEVKDENYFIKYFKRQYAYMLKCNSNVKALSYTKEKILSALENRVIKLNPEAADALFERAATEVNGKYILNTDLRANGFPFCYASEDQYNQITSRISDPVYIVFASVKYMKDLNNSLKYLKAPVELLKVNGNHNVHINNPERIAPYICKILNNRNNSKM